MTRQQANQLLNAVRRGRYVPEHAIITALQTTGDLTRAVRPRKRATTFAGLPRRGARI